MNLPTPLGQGAVAQFRDHKMVAPTGPFAGKAQNRRRPKAKTRVILWMAQQENQWLILSQAIGQAQSGQLPANATPLLFRYNAQWS